MQATTVAASKHSACTNGTRNCTLFCSGSALCTMTGTHIWHKRIATTVERSSTSSKRLWYQSAAPITARPALADKPTITKYRRISYRVANTLLMDHSLRHSMRSRGRHQRHFSYHRAKMNRALITTMSSAKTWSTRKTRRVVTWPRGNFKSAWPAPTTRSSDKT